MIMSSEVESIGLYKNKFNPNRVLKNGEKEETYVETVLLNSLLLTKDNFVLDQSPLEEICREMVHISNERPLLILSVTTNSPNLFPERHLRCNLLNHVVGGKRIRAWFEDYEDDWFEQQIVAYNMFHLCLSFYHVKGPHIDEESIQLLENLASSLEPGILMATSDFFIFYLYHYTVGRFGDAGEDQSYADQIRSRLQQMENISPSPSESILFYPLDFEPNFEFERIPFPFDRDS